MKDCCFVTAFEHHCLFLQNQVLLFFFAYGTTIKSQLWKTAPSHRKKRHTLLWMKQSKMQSESDWEDHSAGSCESSNVDSINTSDNETINRNQHFGKHPFAMFARHKKPSCQTKFDLCCDHLDAASTRCKMLQTLNRHRDNTCHDCKFLQILKDIDTMKHAVAECMVKQSSCTPDEKNEATMDWICHAAECQDDNNNARRLLLPI